MDPVVLFILKFREHFLGWDGFEGQGPRSRTGPREGRLDGLGGRVFPAFGSRLKNLFLGLTCNPINLEHVDYVREDAFDKIAIRCSACAYGHK